MNPIIMLAIHANDAEPILFEAAKDAARYSAWCDYLTGPHIGNLPCDYRKVPERRKAWQQSFLRAKRIVEAFGVEYQQTSEAETLAIAYRLKPGPIAHFDYNQPYPRYRGAQHAEACRQAAERVVRAWRALLEQ